MQFGYDDNAIVLETAKLVNFAVHNVTINDIEKKLKYYLPSEVLFDILVSNREINKFPILYFKYAGLVKIKKENRVYPLSLVHLVRHVAKQLGFTGIHGTLSDICKITGVRRERALEILTCSDIDWTSDNLKSEYCFPSVPTKDVPFIPIVKYYNKVSGF